MNKVDALGEDAQHSEHKNMIKRKCNIMTHCLTCYPLVSAQRKPSAAKDDRVGVIVTGFLNELVLMGRLMKWGKK